MRNILTLFALCACLPASAQTSLDDYRRAVTDYSWELKVAASKSDAAAETRGQAYTGYLPRLSLDGSFTATAHHYDGVERWNFSVLPQLVQTVYGGGAEGVAALTAKLREELADTMTMCGVHSLAEICRDMVFA